MRRILLAAVSLAVIGVAAAPAHAQVGSGNQRRQEQTDEVNREDAARRRRLNREFQRDELPLPELGNSGPCPYVKVLYDAARTIQFNGAPSAAAVGWTGEIQGVSATCRYSEAEPIVVDVIVTFAVGKGPQATGDSITLPYWIAVTHRNAAILGKERFAVEAELPRGEDRTLVYDRVQQIVIPRADAGVSGSNFEVLVGFEVTPEMAAFNRQGSRFRINATGEQAAAQGSTAAQ